MCTAALITIAKTRKQLIYPSMDEQRKSGAYIYMHMCIHVCIILALKRNEILPFVTTQMDLEGLG